MRRHGVHLLGHRCYCLWLSVIFDDVFLVQLYRLSLMSLSNSGFCADVFFIFLGYVAGVFEYQWSFVAIVIIDLGFVAIIFVAVVSVQGALESQWIRWCVHSVD